MSATTFQPGGLAGWAAAVMRGARSPSLSRRAEKQMEVVETLSLGGKRQVALVQCAGRSYLMGMGADSVDSIVEVRGDAVEVPQRGARMFEAGF